MDTHCALFPSTLPTSVFGQSFWVCGYLRLSASICISLIFQCTHTTHTTPSQNVREQRDGSAIHDAKLDLEVELCPGFLGRILCWASKHPHGAALGFHHFLSRAEGASLPQLEPNG